MITFAAVVLLGAGFVIPAMLYGWILDQDGRMPKRTEEWDEDSLDQFRQSPDTDSQRVGALLMARAAVTVQ